MPSTSVIRAGLASRPLLEGLAKNWWLILARGICAIIFGVLAFIWPEITLLTLVVLYGLFALADGVLSLLAAITSDKGDTPAPRWWLAIVGLLGIAAGVVTLLWPGMTAVVLLVFIALWSIATGAMEIVGAIKLRKEIRDEWLLIAAGTLAVLFGLALLAWPAAGALGLILVIGSFAIVYGALLISFAMRLRNFAPAT